MKDQPVLEEFYKRFVQGMNKLYPAAEKPTLILKVSEEQQRRQIEILKQTIPHGRFFFVVNALEKGEVSHAHGLKQWLGIDDRTFSYKHYLTIIHPGYLSSLFMLAHSAHKLANDPRYNVGFMTHKYIIKLPLLSKKENKYVSVVRTLSPWQLDQYSRVTAYINEFQIIGDYREQEPLSPIIRSDFYNRDHHIEDEMRKQTTSQFDKPFSAKELDVLRLLAYQKGITVKEISRILKCKESTVLTYNKRILVKSHALFQFDTKATTEAIAEFLRDLFVI